MSGITTHVLDTSRGKPAARVPVTLALRAPDGTLTALGQGETDSDGRLRTLTAPDARLAVGVYVLRFDVEEYFRALGMSGFYPEVRVVFQVRDPEQHYHVPLLLSPYGYSTYRGS